MKKTEYRVDEPFSVTWKVSVKGRTQGDGQVLTITGQIVHDKIEYFLDKMIAEGKILEYGISVGVDNLKLEKQEKDAKIYKQKKK